MHSKRKSSGGSEQKAKKLRKEPVAAAIAPTAAAATNAPPPSSLATRAAKADAMITDMLHRSKQYIEISKLASLMSTAGTRSLDERVADVVQLLVDDAMREQPLLTLSTKLSVRTVLLLLSSVI